MDPKSAITEVEDFVRLLAKANSSRAIFPDYVLSDSSDYRATIDEITRRRPGILEIARELNPGVERRIVVCLDEEDDLEGAAIACQRLYLILEPEGHLAC